MSHFLVISRHTAESCPMNNGKTRQIALDAMAALPELAKKYDVRVVGSWAVNSEHLVVEVFDAVNLDTLLRLSMEPVLLKWWSLSTTEIKSATTFEETLKLLH